MHTPKKSYFTLLLVYSTLLQCTLCMWGGSRARRAPRYRRLVVCDGKYWLTASCKRSEYFYCIYVFGLLLSERVSMCAGWLCMCVPNRPSSTFPHSNQIHLRTTTTGPVRSFVRLLCVCDFEPTPPGFSILRVILVVVWLMSALVFHRIYKYIHKWIAYFNIYMHTHTYIQDDDQISRANSHKVSY